MRSIAPALILCVLAGCAGGSIKGGQSRHEKGGVTVTYTDPVGGKVIFTDSRDIVATTQPSIKITGDTTNLKAEGADEGKLGGFNFQTKTIKQSPTAWGLIGILIVAGVFFYAIGNWPGVILCGAGVVLAFIYPPALVWIALAAVAWVLWLHRNAIFQMVKGNKNAIDKLADGPRDSNAEPADILKTELQKTQSPAVQRVVAAMKAKL